MALDPETSFPGQVVAANAAYPYGSAQNSVTLGDGIGTPYAADLINDLWGVIQSIMADNGAVINGTPESVSNPQILTALKALSSFRTLAAMKLKAGGFDGEVRTLSGYVANSAVGGGVFYWNAASTATANDVLVVAVTGVTTGRWIRVYNKILRLSWFTTYATAITAIGSDESTLLIDKHCSVAASYTHNLNVKIQFVGGSIMVVGSGVVITNGLPVDGYYTYGYAPISGDVPTIVSPTTIPFSKVGSHVHTAGQAGLVDLSAHVTNELSIARQWATLGWFQLSLTGCTAAVTSTVFAFISDTLATVTEIGGSSTFAMRTVKLLIQGAGGTSNLSSFWAAAGAIPASCRPVLDINVPCTLTIGTTLVPGVFTVGADGGVVISVLVSGVYEPLGFPTTGTKGFDAIAIEYVVHM